VTDSTNTALSLPPSSVLSSAEVDGAMKGIAALWKTGDIVPYLGPSIDRDPPPFPSGEAALAAALGERVSVPGRLRGRVHEVAQYIESHKHRKTLEKLMEELFRPVASPAPFHDLLAAFPVPLVVDFWYSRSASERLLRPGDFQIRAVSRTGSRDHWFTSDRKTDDGYEPAESLPLSARVLYRPLGSMLPKTDVIVSDADFVEILTEIDIQSPIPPWVQRHRTGRHFLFAGLSFDNQTVRTFAKQIIKRSSTWHFAVLDRTPTAKEERFFFREGIRVIPLPLNTEFVPSLDRLLRASGAPT